MTAQGNALGTRSGDEKSHALKGHNKCVDKNLVSPFQGWADSHSDRIPGRCPGLSCFGPFGAAESATTKARLRGDEFPENTQGRSGGWNPPIDKRKFADPVTGRVNKPDAVSNTMRTPTPLTPHRTRNRFHGKTAQPAGLVGRDARRNRLRFDWLEDRTLLATFMVSSTNDSGTGSLRQAILDSDSATGKTNTIDFAIPGSGLQTITPRSPLPSLRTPTVIDGTSQPGYAGTQLIAIDPPVVGSTDNLTISGSDVTLLGIAASGFGLGNSGLQSSVAVVSSHLEPGPGGEIFQYRIDTTTQGGYTAQLQCEGLTARLSLLDSQGNLLVQSDGVTLGDPDGRISEQLPPGSYTLRLELSAGAGTYILTSALSPGSAPFQPLRVESYPNAIVAGDFTDDGRPTWPSRTINDGTVSVLLGNGDGTFQPQVTYAVGA